MSRDISQSLEAIPRSSGSGRALVGVLSRAVKSGQIGVAVLVLLFVGYWLSPDFLTSTNVRNLLNQASIFGVLALAQFFVVLIGGFDLSVAAVLALSSVIIAKLAPQHGLLVGSAVAVVAGLGLGALSGVATTLGRVPPMIATLSVGGIARGLAFVVTLKSVLVPLKLTAPLQATVGVFTTTTIAWFVLTAAIAWMLARTRMGRHLHAIGGNERSARLAGIPVRKLQIATYSAAGALSALGGVLFVVRSSSGVPHVGAGWELGTIAGIVIGGTALNGGEGHVVKAMAGVLVYQMINNLMNLVSLNPYYQDVVKAAVVVLVVGVSVVKTERGARRV